MNSPEKGESAYKKISSQFVNLFPLWTTLSALLALVKPEIFSWFTTGYFTAGLGLLMLSMGITLSVKDFMDVIANPAPVFLGFLGCYGLMPYLAMALGKVFKLPAELLAGLVLVGSVNGGQASNLCTYIAKGNVALSVVMTTATTIGAIFMTPLLCKYLLGTIVPIDALGIALSTVQVVLFPIGFGMLLNKYANKLVSAVLPFSPVVGVISTVLLVSSAVAQCSKMILSAGLSLQWPTIALHVVGGLLGYWIPKVLGYDEVSSRTMAIETAMKSSAFGFLLAKLHFAEYAARVPSAVSVVWMAITGSTMAVIWRFMFVKDEKKKINLNI
jgi:BASS family bile acid:Na+ symporter